MRMLAIALLLAGPAWAQNVVNPAPAALPAPADVAPLDRAPADVAPQDQPAPGDQPAPAPKVLTPAPPPLAWQQRGQGVVQVLDKVAGRATTVTIPVGSTGQAGPLMIDLRSCYGRPADQPPDATAYLIVRTAPATLPLFSGWMLQSEPAASLMQDPVYDIRLESCT